LGEAFFREVQMMTDHDVLRERQERVYEVLDVATKPAQLVIGGLQFFFLLLVIAAVCIVAPIYAYLHGDGFSSFQFAAGCWVLGFVIMFFGAPFYTVFWGAVIFISLFWWDINANEASHNLFAAVLWLYEGIGLLLILSRIVRWARRRRAQRIASASGT
jgi:hypothetical protein